MSLKNEWKKLDKDIKSWVITEYLIVFELFLGLFTNLISIIFFLMIPTFIIGLCITIKYQYDFDKEKLNE
jgi:hypothetical protein